MKSENAGLVLVDIQNDFCAGGALPVPESDQVCKAVNRVLPKFDFVVATQDWHPADHCSFTDQGGPWPAHCIQKTSGAELHPDIDPHAVDVVIQKADQPGQEAYSDFEGHDDQGRPLHDILQERGIRRLYVAGLATDYCVRATVLDALKLGYQVSVITDGIRAINAKAGGKALKEMKSLGAKLVTSKELLA
jgi:nicotinamidase/pyrazinamidase